MAPDELGSGVLEGVGGVITGAVACLVAAWQATVKTKRTARKQKEANRLSGAILISTGEIGGSLLPFAAPT